MVHCFSLLFFFFNFLIKNRGEWTESSSHKVKIQIEMSKLCYGIEKQNKTKKVSLGVTLDLSRANWTKLNCIKTPVVFIVKIKIKELIPNLHAFLFLYSIYFVVTKYFLRFLASIWTFFCNMNNTKFFHFAIAKCN